MNFKSKKAVFDEKIINKEEISDDTRKKLRDSKYLILLMDFFMICVNGFMLAYFVVKGFNIVALTLICVVLAMDVIHFGLSFALNYRFKYNMVFTLAFSAVSLLLTGVLYLISDMFNDGITIFETFGVAVSIAIRLIYFITVLVLMALIAKKKIKIVQPIALILVAGLLFGATITYNVVRGVYGDGSGLMEGNRTLEYMLKKDDDGDKYYEVVGSLDSGYTNVVIPDEFNGYKVRAVDYSLFLTPEVKNVELKSTEPISITNSLNKDKISDDLNISVRKELIDDLKASVYNDEKLNDNLTNLINKVDPIISSDEYAVKFNFDASNMPEVLKGKYLDTIYLKKNTDTTTVKKIFDMEENADYKDFYYNNIDDNNFQWNYDDVKNKKAMVLDVKNRNADKKAKQNNQTIDGAADIAIHFEDVIKITYNFSPELEDTFEPNVIDVEYPDLIKDKYVIKSNVDSIEFYENVRPGCSVEWMLKSSDDTNLGIIGEKEKVADILKAKDLKSDNELKMEADWTMNIPKIDLFELQDKDGETIDSIVYGEYFKVVFKESNKAVNRKYSWLVKQQATEILNISYGDITYFDNFVFLEQNSAIANGDYNGLFYEYQDVNGMRAGKELALLNNTILNGGITMQMTFEVTDENWSALKASSNPSIDLKVQQKEVNLNWSWNEGEPLPTEDVVYKAYNNTVSAAINDADILAYDMPSNQPSLNLSGQNIRFAGNYTTTAKIENNLNYIIGNGKDTKKIKVTPAKIDIKYTVTASNFDMLNNVSDISDKLKYIGYLYNVKPSMTILDINGAPITLEDAELHSGFRDEMAITWAYASEAAAVRNAGAYTISYGFNEEVSADVKKSYLFVNKQNEVTAFDYSFDIKQAELAAKDITWSTNSIVYSGKAQSRIGTFAGIGGDVDDETVIKIVATESETNAKEYVNSAVSIADVSANQNYKLIDAAKSKTFRIERKLITDGDITANNQNLTFSNQNLNGGQSGFELSTSLNDQPQKLIINDAIFESFKVSEFVNAGVYSEINVTIGDMFKDNYSFTAFLDNEDSYTATKKLETQTLTIDIYSVKSTDLALIGNKIYDANLKPIAETIASEIFGNKINYTVGISTGSASDGVKAGKVSYKISEPTVGDDITLIKNYGFTEILAATFEYEISKRAVALEISDMDSIIYTGSVINFGYTVTPNGADIDNCNAELYDNDFIDFSKLNAINVIDGGYLLTNAHIVQGFSVNYELAQEVSFAVKPFELSNSEINISWGSVSGEYNGSAQGLSGNFRGLNGTQQNITGVTYTDVKRDGYLIDNADVLPYVYEAADFTINSPNYILSEANDLTYTITPKAINQSLDIIVGQRNSNLETVGGGGKDYVFVYSGNANEIKGRNNESLWFRTGNNNSPKIPLKPFRNTAFDSVSADFTNATVDENFKVQEFDLAFYSEDGNYVFNTVRDYTIKIDKQSVTLNIAESLSYSGAEQYPKITNENIGVDYELVEGTDHKSVGQHGINVILQDEFKRNYNVSGASDEYTLEHQYGITPMSVDVNENIIYKATQDISDIAGTFDTMSDLNNIIFNNKPWYIVARVTVVTVSGDIETAYVYTGTADHFSMTEAGTYRINIDGSAIETYGDGNTLDVKNYSFTNMVKEVVIGQFKVTQDMIQVYFDDESESNLIENPYADYNGNVRALNAKFTPTYEGAVQMTLEVSVEEIKNAKDYVATFTFGENANNYIFAEGAGSLTFTVNQAVIDASVNTIEWTVDVVEYQGSKTEPFMGVLNYNGIEIAVTSAFKTNDAGDYTNGGGYEDGDFVLSDTNYRLENVNQTFTITKAVINNSEILWYADGSETGVTESVALKSLYNFGDMPEIVARYKFIIGGESVYEIIFVVTPAKEGEIYNATDGKGINLTYNFVASLSAADAVNFEFGGESQSVSRIVGIDKLVITDANAVEWNIEGAVTGEDGRVTVEYSGKDITPKATIGDKAELLILAQLDEHINVSDTPYTVGLDANQTNFTLGEGVTFNYSYYIVKKALTAADVVFRNNTATDGTVSFEYREGGLTDEDLSAYIIANGEEFPVTVTNLATEHNVGVTYTLEVSMANENFYLEGTVDYTIVPKTMIFEWSALTVTYDLNGKTQVPKLKINGTPVADVLGGLSVKEGEGEDSFVKVVDGQHLVNAGKYVVKYSSDITNGNYFIENETAEFSIEKLDINNFSPAMFELSKTVVPHTGQEIEKPEVRHATNDKIKFTGNSVKLYLRVNGNPSAMPVEKLIDAGSYVVEIDCAEEVNFKGTIRLLKYFTVKK